MGICLEKRSDRRLGFSVVERPFWNGLLPLCVSGKHFETICLVCTQAGEWCISYGLRFRLVFHCSRWRHTDERRTSLRFAFEHYWSIGIQLCLHRGELQKCLFSKAFVNNIVLLLLEGIQPSKQPKRGIVRHLFSSPDFNNKYICLLPSLLWKQDCEGYVLPCIEERDRQLHLRPSFYERVRH